jgi:FdhD protein
MPVSRELNYLRYESGRLAATSGHVVVEGLVRLHVNGRELAMLMCTPDHLDWLAVGFLRSEGLIAGPEEVRRIVVCPSRACVEVWLHRADFEPPVGRIITSGCGGGITFADLSADAQPLASELRVTARQLGRLMFAMQETERTRGVHTAALAEVDGAQGRLLAVVEDVGRHNTIDKLWGRCLSEGIATRDRVVLSTGRISSEMLNKVARMAAPVVVSRTSPTTLSVALARAWNVTLVGYARRDSLNVYSGEARVLDDQE